ncbi:MAG TPA: hypothetical protein VK129_01105 [Terriglobales bacterium]|nr:hypothetical protein [Terriglobales bacterium]
MAGHPQNPHISTTPQTELSTLIQEQSPELLRSAAADKRLTEDLALALLQRRDLPAAAIEAMVKNGSVMKHRSVINAVVVHPHAPRHVSLPIIRRLFAFELMNIALTPAVFADIKKFAEDVLVSRLENTTPGERMSLAKRSSPAVAAALLLDPERRIMEATLQNARITEAAIVKALMRDDAPQHLIDTVCHDPKWSLRREIRIALLRNEKTPLAPALAFAESMSSAALRQVLNNSRLRPNVKSYLIKMLEERKSI